MTTAVEHEEFTTRLISPEAIQMADTPVPIDVSDGLTYTERKVQLTAEFADKHLSLPALKEEDRNLERPLNDSHVATLLTAMLRGTFRPEQCLLSTCTLDGVTYRTNGQHTCWARSFYADEMKKLHKRDNYAPEIKLLKYTAQSFDQLRDLYASTDRGLSRSQGHVVITRLFGTEEFKDVPRVTLRRLAEGLGCWRWEDGNERKRHDADDRAERLKTEYHDLAIQIARFLGQGKPRVSKHINRAAVIGAMFATFEKGVKNATEFWEAVREGLGLTEKADPRHTLRNALMSASVALGSGSTTGKKAVSQEEMYRWCLLAWNAWREKRKLQQLKPVLGSPRPKVRA